MMAVSSPCHRVILSREDGEGPSRVAQGMVLRFAQDDTSRLLWSAEAAPPLSYSHNCESGGAASALHTTTRRTRVARGKVLRFAQDDTAISFLRMMSE